ncbi:MAG: carbon-nitrogen hydrolase family protein [Methanospirillum sp.]
MTGSVRIALAQLLPAWEDPGANLAAIDGAAERAADAGADLVVFPEQVLFGWDPKSVAGAEPVGGPLTQALRAVARRYAIGLVGSIRESSTDGVRNTAIAIDASGAIDAVYAKQHLFAFGGEEVRYVPGTGMAIFDCGGLRMGLAICYDLRFPAVFAAYRGLGADAVLVPAAWPCARLSHWRLFLCARALDNRIFVAGASYAVGATPIEAYCGGSLAADPEGEILVEAGAGPELLIAELDAGAIGAARAGPDPAGR